MTFSPTRLAETFQREVDEFSLATLTDEVDAAARAFEAACIRADVGDALPMYRQWLLRWTQAARAVDRYDAARRRLGLEPDASVRVAGASPAIGRRPTSFVEEVDRVLHEWVPTYVNGGETFRETARTAYANGTNTFGTPETIALTEYEGWSDLDLWFFDVLDDTAATEPGPAT